MQQYLPRLRLPELALRRVLAHDVIGLIRRMSAVLTDRERASPPLVARAPGEQ